MSWKKENKFKILQTIRSRLIFGYATVLLLSIIIVSVCFYWQMNRRLITTAKVYLRDKLTLIVRLIQQETEPEVNLTQLLSRQTFGQSGLYEIQYDCTSIERGYDRCSNQSIKDLQW